MKKRSKKKRKSKKRSVTQKKRLKKISDWMGKGSLTELESKELGHYLRRR